MPASSVLIHVQRPQGVDQRRIAHLSIGVGQRLAHQLDPLVYRQSTAVVDGRPARAMIGQGHDLLVIGTPIAAEGMQLPPDWILPQNYFSILY